MSSRLPSYEKISVALEYDAQRVERFLKELPEETRWKIVNARYKSFIGSALLAVREFIKAYHLQDHSINLVSEPVKEISMEHLFEAISHTLKNTYWIGYLEAKMDGKEVECPPEYTVRASSFFASFETQEEMDEFLNKEGENR